MPTIADENGVALHLSVEGIDHGVSCEWYLWLTVCISHQILMHPFAAGEPTSTQIVHSM